MTVRLSLIICLLNTLSFVLGQESEKFEPMFNGKNLDGWVNVNCAPSTWSVNDQGYVVCTGKPIGEIRTTRMYQNFILELEWRHLKPKGNAGVFVWSDDITAKGQPFIRGVEIQVLENAYGKAKWFTTHGDIFPIHGAKMTPINGRGGMRAFPIEERSKPSPEWNHYRIECRDGAISLAVNGKVVTQGKDASPKKGYICLESEGGVVHYRNVKLAELPDTPIDAKDIAISDRGFKCLYNGVDWTGWVVPESSGWKSNDWIIRHTKAEQSSIETAEKYGDIEFIVDFSAGKDFKSGTIHFRGMEFPIKSEKPGKWHRFEARVQGDECAIKLDGKPISSSAIISSQSGSIRLICEGEAEWANVYVRAVQ